jgi:hypothetical protein
MKARSLAFVTLAIVALFVVRLVESERRYTFGHPGMADTAVGTMLWLFAITHAVVAGIMFAQRQAWVPSEAAMFRFVAVKSLFWLNFATLFQPAGLGIRLDVVVLYVLVAGTTIDLDIRLIRRYVFGSEDAALYGGMERRSDPPGRRSGDA